MVDGVARKISGVTMRQLSTADEGMGDKVLIIEGSTCDSEMREKLKQD
jgi:hypothetical protein